MIKNIYKYLYKIIILSIIKLMNYKSSDYNRKNFNCVDTSILVYNKLKTYGFNPVIVYGNGNKSGHLWIELNGFIIETTSKKIYYKSNFIAYNHYKNKYNINRKYFNNVYSFLDFSENNHWTDITDRILKRGF